MNPNHAKIVSLPLIVVHRESPLSWRTLAGKAEPEKNLKDNPHFVGSNPEIPLVEWKKGIMLPADPPVPRAFDGYMVREQFMGLRTSQELVTFLNQYGRFSPLPKLDVQVGWTLDTLIKFQEVFGALAKLTPNKWTDYANSLMSLHKSGTNILAVLAALNWSRSTIEFQPNQTSIWTLKGAKYAGVIETNNVVSTILTTLQIDHVRGAKFRACARRDCKRFYEITTKHKRKYCGPYCAHLETVRRLRRRQKAESDRSRKAGR